MTSSFRGHILQCVFSIIFVMISLPSMTSSMNVVETVVFVDKSAQTRWNKTAKGVAKTDMETEVRSMMLEVNEIYKGIPSLNIRIHIKELVILERDVTFPNAAGYMGAEPGMGYFQNYLDVYAKKTYDMALLLTGQNLYGANVFGADGYANIQSVCTKTSAAIITLDPTPRTVYIIAHEIGHVLGARHDGDGNNCDSNKKYLMTWASLMTENRYKLSWCSKTSIQDTTNRLIYRQDNCLADKQDVKDDTVPRFGSLMTGDSMCKRYYGSQSYFGRKYYSVYGDDVCLRVTCFKKKEKKTGKLLFYYKPSGDGLHCGKNKQCMRGKCVQTSNGLSTISDSCPFGDQHIIENSNKTCKQVTASDCKDKKYARPCCHTCQK